MPRKKRLGRPKSTAPTRTETVSIRLTAVEREMVRRAAGEIPVSIWARIEVVRAAKRRD